MIKRFFENFEEYISAVLLGCMVILIFLQILFRFLFNFPLRWTEEAARYTLVLLVYLSACTGVKKEKHIRVEAILNALPAVPSFLYWLVGNVIWFVFNGAMVYYGIDTASMIFRSNQVSPVLHIPMGVLYSVIPVCFGIMDIRIAQLVVEKIRAFGKSGQHTEGGTKE